MKDREREGKDVENESFSTLREICTPVRISVATYSGGTEKVERLRTPSADSYH